MRTPVAGSDIALPGLLSELFEASDLAAAGDPWPEAILLYRAGYSDRLANLIETEGLPEDTGARRFVADIVAGRFKRTKADAGITRNAKILMTVSMLQTFMEASNEGRFEFPAAAPKLKTMDDVYRRAGEDFNLTAEGVRKVVERNRRRLRLVNGTNTPDSNVADK